MNRKEEITNKLLELIEHVRNVPKNEALLAVGLDIAEWADENPDEKRIAKYLYEKKGYPIDLNGNLPSFDETMKDAEKYLKYKQDKFIEKACEFIFHRVFNCAEGSIIEDFKNYMKGE